MFYYNVKFLIKNYEIDINLFVWVLVGKYFLFQVFIFVVVGLFDLDKWVLR